MKRGRPRQNTAVLNSQMSSTLPVSSIGGLCCWLQSTSNFYDLFWQVRLLDRTQHEACQKALTDYLREGAWSAEDGSQWGQTCTCRDICGNACRRKQPGPPKALCSYLESQATSNPPSNHASKPIVITTALRTALKRNLSGCLQVQPQSLNSPELPKAFDGGICFKPW